ncbi:CD5 antigen-like [Cebidichthys violaceus]|uniref:CD5 antigen-like n=1 Tax=Cebidichthys violaceus TaxID=271503 RepID=UPI0035CB31D7
MDHLLMLLLLWSSGLQAEGNLTSTEHVRLVGRNSRCAGMLQVKLQRSWRLVSGPFWRLKEAEVACRDLDCGSAVSIRERRISSLRSVWLIRFECLQSGYTLRDCLIPSHSILIVSLTCSDSVRLVNGTSLCSGRLEVKCNQSNQWWSSVCGL